MNVGSYGAWGCQPTPLAWQPTPVWVQPVWPVWTAVRYKAKPTREEQRSKSGWTEAQGNWQNFPAMPGEFLQYDDFPAHPSSLRGGAYNALRQRCIDCADGTVLTLRPRRCNAHGCTRLTVRGKQILRALELLQESLDGDWTLSDAGAVVTQLRQQWAKNEDGQGGAQESGADNAHHTGTLSTPTTNAPEEGSAQENGADNAHHTGSSSTPTTNAPEQCGAQEGGADDAHRTGALSTPPAEAPEQGGAPESGADNAHHTGNLSTPIANAPKHKRLRADATSARGRVIITTVGYIHLHALFPASRALSSAMRWIKPANLDEDSVRKAIQMALKPSLVLNCLAVHRDASFDEHNGMHPDALQVASTSSAFAALVRDIKHRLNAGAGELHVVLFCRDGRYRSVAAAELCAAGLRNVMSVEVDVHHSCVAFWPHEQKRRCLCDIQPETMERIKAVFGLGGA